MPLSGLVPVQSSHRFRQLQAQQKTVNWIPDQTNNKNSGSCNSPKRPSSVGSSRQEIWIDGDFAEQNTNSVSKSTTTTTSTHVTTKPTYGYMDEQKASMINNWVEKQSVKGTDNESSTVFLTQFKQVEDLSDEIYCETGGEVVANTSRVHPTTTTSSSNNGQQCQVIVHQEQETKPKSKQPPPPPPRRTTPPRTAAGEQPSLVTGLSESIPMIDDHPELITQVQNNETSVKISTEISCQVDEMDLGNCEFPPQPHPLRILSEENLTIVSSFAGSLNELPNSDDDEKVDASRLSFFKVPDFGANENDCRIEQTFKDFEELQNNKNNEIFEQPVTSYEDPRFKQDNISGEKLKTFSSKTELNQQTVPSPKLLSKTELITPQKQFLLLSQSLRHPDGSSNPELNIMNIVENKQLPVAPQQQRSPGNGRSSSDMENDNKIDNYCPDTTQESIEIVEASSPNNNSVFTEMVVPIETSPSDSKPKNKFGFRFLRFFGSTRNKKGTNMNNQSHRRAKSVDRKLEKVQSVTEVKSSSSSPMVVTKKMAAQSCSANLEDPALLSISTEWEFEPQEEDEQNGNKNSSTLFSNILIQKKPASNKSSKDRKSSGYDSLGGDESSSLDSNEHPTGVATTNSNTSSQENETPRSHEFETTPSPLLPSTTNKPIRLSREMNNSLAKAFFAAKRQPMIHPEIQPQYSMPNDYYGQIANHNQNRSSATGLNIMQYDELDIMRMEQRQQKKPAF